MKLVEMRSDDVALGDVDGALRTVNISLIEAPAVGDYVIVHAGFAIEKLDQQEANERLSLFEELARVQMAADGRSP